MLDLAENRVAAVLVVAVKWIGLISLLEMGVVWPMEDCSHENVAKVTHVE